ncbi:MAG: hypothetical protein ACI8UD_000221 [Planctomycetota bacterium]|jgi:hypothetical protein
MLQAMAVSGTVAASKPTPLQPTTVAKWVRRSTLVFAVVCGLWFFLKFGTQWVPAGMNTVTEIPAGSWVVVDRWASGLRVGSDVFIDTPHGELLSRVTELRDDEVVISHPAKHSGYGDSALFGALPRANVRSTIVVVFAPDGK